jgi:nucleoside phosphorylase
MIAVLVALRKAIETFLGQIRIISRKRAAECTFWEGSCCDVQVRVVATGVGREPASDALRGCSAIISTGFCGALKENAHTGDIVVARSVAHADRDLIAKILHPGSFSGVFEGSGVFDIHMDDDLLSSLQLGLDGSALKIHTGRTLTCARSLQNAEEKEKIGRYFDALAVDMEDYFRLRAARQLGTRIWCARAVLDEKDDPIPSFRSDIKSVKVASLLQKLPPAQQSVSLMLKVVIPALIKKIDIV